MNLFNKVVNIKSNVPKKAATATEMPITIKVYLMVSCLVGQLTFFISRRTSFKKVMTFLGMLLKFIRLEISMDSR